MLLPLASPRCRHKESVCQVLEAFGQNKSV